MDIHRSRFVPYPTSAISALAFSTPSDSGRDGDSAEVKLAIGRANGDIEIWNAQHGDWVQESIFRGDGRSIDGVLWTQDEDEMTVGQYRLFSISSLPSIAEWDLATGLIKRRSTGNFSEVWCFAAQPRISTSAQDIVAGCGDGNLVLFSTADNDLQFKRTLARVSGKDARCMCVTYQTRERVVAGFADSVIRIYDTRNGSLLRNMSLGVGRPGAPKTALVWQVKCLPNGDVVSGDSNGELRIWDGKTYSLSQRLLGHDSDLLDLVTSRDGNQIVSGSIDGRISVYYRSDEAGRSVWVKSSHRKLHNGEVKAMASFESGDVSVLVTGGGDVAPVVTPLRGYGKENVRFLPSLPQRAPLVSAPRARLMVSWWDKTVSIWRIARRSEIKAPAEHRRSRKLVASVRVESKQRIRSVAISPDGRLVAVACSDTMKVFQLRHKPGQEKLAVRRLGVPATTIAAGARLLEFSPNNKWLLVGTTDNENHVARFVQHPSKPKQIQILPVTAELDRRQRQDLERSAFRTYDASLDRAAFSSDSNMLVVSDRSGHLDSWLLNGNEDSSAAAVGVSGGDHDSNSGSGSESAGSDDNGAAPSFYGQYWIENGAASLLPKLDSMPLVMSFRPSTKGKEGSLCDPNVNGDTPDLGQHQAAYRLLILTASHELYEFDMQTGRLSKWSRKNPTRSLPAEFARIRDRVMDALWDVSAEHQRLWLYGPSFVCMLDVGPDDDTAAHFNKSRKRRNKTDGMTTTEMRKRRRLESGAGGVIPSAETQGIANRHDNDKSIELTRTEVEDDVRPGDDVDDDARALPLALIGDYGRQLGGDPPPQLRKWWCSHRYSPILGVVQVEDDTISESVRQPLEVVLVERPVEIS